MRRSAGLCILIAAVAFASTPPPLDAAPLAVSASKPAQISAATVRPEMLAISAVSLNYSAALQATASSSSEAAPVDNGHEWWFWPAWILTAAGLAYFGWRFATRDTRNFSYAPSASDRDDDEPRTGGRSKL